MEPSPKPGPAPVTISAVVPTLDEEANLQFLLPTLGWCDEVVVVDQGSRDRTLEVARELGARVLEIEWQPEFDRARAAGAAEARGDWIFTLDADEMIPRALAARLRRAAENDEADIVGVARLNYFHGPLAGAGLWPDTQHRFFRRGAVELSSEVHDYLKPLSDRVLTLPAKPELAIHHFSYTSAFDQLDKLNRYTELETQKPPQAGGGFLRPAVRAFLSRYLRRGGFRYGRRGLWHSAFWGIYFFVTAVKRWEKGALPAAKAEEDRARQELLAAWEKP